MDKNRSGTLSVADVKIAVQKAHFNFQDEKTLDKLVAKFDYFQQKQLTFAQYMELAIFLGNIRNNFDVRDWARTGYLVVSWNDFVQLMTEL